MNFCLTKEDFDYFLDHYLHDYPIENMEDGFLKTQLINCFNWEDEISLLTYYLTHYLKKKSNSGNPINNQQINLYYELGNSGYFNVEQIDREFVKYLFHYSRGKMTEPLPETLNMILQNYKDHTYDSSFCI